MQLQDLSYTLNNEKIRVTDKVNGIDYFVSMEVVSLENVYTIPSFEKRGDGYVSQSVVWGNNEQADGKARLQIKEFDKGVSFCCSATLDKSVRSIKVRFDNLPLGTLVSSIDEDKK
ncbi:MAG: hypothetical protein L6V83_05990 [Christensenella sp.]|nr:MAG: hypothetical protein L6V83_05990 [Christensenella sp.]